MSPTRLVHAGALVGAMQLEWSWELPDAAYVTERGWQRAILECFPFHPEGGCGIEKLGSYPRVEPPGTRVPRWWCPKARASISLLPSFLAARFTGTLDAVEEVVATVEGAASIAGAVDRLLPPDVADAVTLPSALRWIWRRVLAVRAALLATVTLLPERFTGVRPTIGAVGAVLGTRRVLVTLRGMLGRHLASLPAPLGFRPRVIG